MKIKKLFFFIIFIGIFANAQNFPNSLTLDEAIEYGINNNFSVKNANREIEKAQKDRWSTIAIGLPSKVLRAFSRTSCTVIAFG